MQPQKKIFRGKKRNVTKANLSFKKIKNFFNWLTNDCLDFQSSFKSCIGFWGFKSEARGVKIKSDFINGYSFDRVKMLNAFDEIMVFFFKARIVEKDENFSKLKIFYSYLWKE